MSSDYVETRMFTIFQLVNDWLKYAEAKNLAVLAVSGAACSALASYLGSTQNLSPGWKRVLLGSIFSFALSGLTSLLSFSPRTSQEYILALFPDWGAPAAEDNLYFYKHLGKYDAETLAAKYQELFSSGPNTHSSSQTQLAAQIIVNSRIVVYKLRFFVVALVFSSIAITIFLIAFISMGIMSL